MPQIAGRDVRSRPSWRALLASACLEIASSVLLIGCDSGATSSPTPVPNSPRALSAVVRASRATGTTTAVVRMSFARTPWAERGRGAFDFSRARGSVVLYPTVRTSPTSAVDHAWAAVFDPGAAYYQPARTSHWKLPAGKPWITIDMSQADEISKSLPRVIPQLEAVNPVIGLQALRWGAVAATPVQQGAKAGGRLREYRVTVDFQTAAARFAGPYKRTFLAAIGSTVTLSDRLATRGRRLTVQLLVWIDRRGRLVQLEKLTRTGRGTTLMAFGSFGQRVTVSAPPLSRSVSITKVAPSGERENRGGGDSDGA